MYTITDAITQNTPGTSEGFPVGVPTGYSWYGGGGHTTTSGDPLPSNFTAVTAWGQIYPEAGFSNSFPPSDYIQIANAKTYVHLKGTDQWVLVQDQATDGLDGAHFVANFSGNSSPWHKTVLPDGSVTVDPPPSGYNDHFWPTARGTYAAGSVDAVYVQMDMRTNDPNLHVIASVGADWWRDASAPFLSDFSNNPTAGLSNWVELTTSWRTLAFYSSTAAQFQADPPPLFGPLTVDTVAPLAPAITSNTLATNVVTLNGSAEALSTIAVSDGTNKLGTAQADAQGSWSFTSALTVGTHTLTATAADVAGNVSAQSAPLTVNVQSAPPPSGNLVNNGSFEIGNLNGWALSGNTQSSTYGPEVYITRNANDGSWALGAGPVGTDGIVSQNISTVAGQHYTLSFWLANEGGGPNDFAVKWNNQTLMSLNNQPSQPYTQYTFEVVGVQGTSKLEFDFRQDPIRWDLDGVSLAALGQFSAAATSPASSPITTSPTNSTQTDSLQTLATPTG